MGALGEHEELLRGSNLLTVRSHRFAGQSAAGADIEQIVFAAGLPSGYDNGAVVFAAAYRPDAAITHGATHFFVLTLRQYGSNGSLKATIGTLDGNTVDVAKFAPGDFGVSASGVALAAGDYLTLLAHQNDGTGLAVPAGLLQIAAVLNSDEE